MIGASTDTAHVCFAWRRSDTELAQALGILDPNEHVAYRAIVDPDNVIQHLLHCI